MGVTLSILLDSLDFETLPEKLSTYWKGLLIHSRRQKPNKKAVLPKISRQRSQRSLPAQVPQTNVKLGLQITAMPFSHHSHSGQFCPDHAKNKLEEMVKTAIAKSMEVFALTEHMPRNDQDRYPEEIEMGWTLATSQTNHRDFYREATRLRGEYGSRIQILIGFESEWIRPSSQDLIAESLQAYSFDLFVGSVHHVHTKPIDYDQAGYDTAKALAGGTDRQLFNDYFDAQFSMLQAVRPPVIGHFDLIRLKSEEPSRDLRLWPDVWQRIMRNLQLIVSNGSLLEINFASLRKGLSEPYPKGEIAQVSSIRRRKRSSHVR